jgi:hypothetical protein
MLTIQDVKVNSFSLSHLDVFWEVAVSGSSPNDYAYVVERSYAEYGPFEQVSTTIIDRYHFRDTSATGWVNHWDTLYYRIKVTDRRSGAVTYSPSNGSGVSMSARPNLAALEMARQTNLKLKEFTGREVLVFKKRTFGAHCPACMSTIQQRRVRSGCKTCFGTGFVGGYHAPLLTWIQISDAPNQESTTEAGKIQIKNGAFKAGNTPALDSGDILVEADNRRWSVRPGVNVVEHGRAAIRQEGTLFAIPRDGVEYELPVNYSLDKQRALEASPNRGYTVPQTLEAVSLDKAIRAQYTGEDK